MSVDPIKPSDAFAPEFYADQLEVGSSPWGFIFKFGLLSDGGNRPVATVRMSPQHAKIMYLLLGRLVREWEAQMEQEIRFPDEMLRNLNLEDE